MLYILFLGICERARAWGTEVHPRFPLGKAQDQFSLFLPVFLNAGLSHHHPASVPHLDFGVFSSSLLPLPYFVPLFWVWRQGFGVYCMCVYTSACAMSGKSDPAEGGSGGQCTQGCL